MKMGSGEIGYLGFVLEKTLYDKGYAQIHLQLEVEQLVLDLSIKF